MPDFAGFPSTNGVITLLPPPEGYVVDFDNPQRYYSTEIYTTFAVGNLLSLVFLYQRFYTKIFLAKGFQIDDGFLTASYLLSIATQVIIVYTLVTGIQGVHAWEIPIEKFEKYVLMLYTAPPIYAVCSSFAKLALLFFYLRLSPLPGFQIAVWTTIVAVCLYTPIVVFGLIFVCDPVRKAWTVTEDVSGSCISQTALFIAIAVTNIISDIVMFILPLPMLYSLRMRLAHKIGVACVFGIGSITVITSIIRAAYLSVLFTDPDSSWATAPASFWVIIESNLLIICGSVPTLRRFVNHVAPRLLSSSQNSSRSDPNVPRSRSYATTPRRRNRRYSRFGNTYEDEDVEFHTISRMGVKTGKSGEEPTTVVTGIGTTTVEAGHNDSWDARSRGEDDDSEQAILTTRTVTVQYS